MKTITEDEREQIFEILTERGVSDVCPRCFPKKRSVIDGYFKQTFNNDLNIRQFNFNGLTIPSAVIICNHCGFMSQHSLGVLGLLSDSPEH